VNQQLPKVIATLVMVDEGRNRRVVDPGRVSALEELRAETMTEEASGEVGNILQAIALTSGNGH
jgi:hypothetical protein